MWKTIETQCLNCGRNVQARPVKKPYKPTKNIDWTPMEYRCECGNVDILNDYGNYRLWQSSQGLSDQTGRDEEKYCYNCSKKRKCKTVGYYHNFNKTYPILLCSYCLAWEKRRKETNPGQSGQKGERDEYGKEKPKGNRYRVKKKRDEVQL